MPKKENFGPTRIGSLDYEVEYRNLIVNDRKQELLGEHSYSDGVILLYDGMKPDLEATVYLHEVLHGIFSQCPLPEACTPHEEVLVEVISNNIVSLFKNNPEQAKLFMKKIGVISGK